jgi:hypothetical protein
MNEVEAAIEYVEREQEQARTFAIEAFTVLSDRGVTPSVEVDGNFYVSTEILAILAQASASAALALGFTEPSQQASKAVGKIAQFLDSINREAKGDDQPDVKGAAKSLGLL